MEGLTQALMLSGLGIGLGIGAAFTGLGGGFLMIPLLLFTGCGFSAEGRPPL